MKIELHGLELFLRLSAAQLTTDRRMRSELSSITTAGDQYSTSSRFDLPCIVPSTVRRGSPRQRCKHPAAHHLHRESQIAR